MAGGVTSLVCMPDTDPVLDEPGLVEMLKYRAEKLHQARVFPLGALTRNLEGETLTEMVELTEAGCVGFSQAEVALGNPQVLQLEEWLTAEPGSPCPPPCRCRPKRAAIARTTTEYPLIA